MQQSLISKQKTTIEREKIRRCVYDERGKKLNSEIL
jgi:hypothetical protein